MNAGCSESFGPGWRRALFVMLAVAILCAGGIRLLRPVWVHHFGDVRSDGFTYCAFARQLAQGRFFYDHPIAQVVAQTHDSRIVAEGPVWNTGIRRDGRMVYTVSIGYPAFLAVMYKAGGAWLMVHANFFLLIAALACFFLLTWEAGGRGVAGLLTAASAVLLLPRMDPSTFNQFTYPWREPLSYIFVLLAALAAFRYRMSSRSGWLPWIGLCFGLACAVKEANVVYGPWLAVFVLLTPGAILSRGFWIGTVAAMVGWVAGLAPLLVQNYLCTGNPLVPLQVVRETANFSVTEPGAGLSLGNAVNTIRDYWHLYRPMPWVGWAVPAALLGVVATCRTPGGQMFLGLLVSHLLLYFQWGNADYRHLYFAFVPAVFFVVSGAAFAFGILGRLTGRSARSIVVTLGGLAVLVWIAAWPCPWAGVLKPLADVVPSEEIERLVSAIESATPTNALILVNRTMRDQWGAYGTRHFIQLHELRGLGRCTNAAEAVSLLRDRGLEVFFLDAQDRTPSHHGCIDWSIVDREWLLARFDLDPVWTTEIQDRAVRYFTEAPALTLHSVRPWSNIVSTVWLRLMDPNPALLLVDPREAGSDLVVRVNGQTLTQAATDAYFPLHGPYSDPALAVAISRRSGLPVPDKPVARLIGWTEEVWQATCDYASPPDRAVFPDGLPPQPSDVSFRVLTGATRVRVPCRTRDDRFPVIRLETRSSVPNQVFGVRFGPPGAPVFSFDSRKPWIPIVAGRATDVGMTEFTLLDVPPEGLSLHGIGAGVAWRRMRLHTSTHSVLAAIAGVWVPDLSDDTNGAWEATLNGTAIDGGFTGFDPSELRQSLYFATPPRGGESVVEWRGMGVAVPKVVETGPRLSIRMDQPTRAFCESGLHDIEALGDQSFAWTKARLRLRVPLTPGVETYRFRLNAVDGHPYEDRDVTVEIGLFVSRIRLEDVARAYVLTVPTPDAEARMATVTLSVPTWSPLEILKVNDARRLGFQFFEADWEPGGPVDSRQPFDQ